MKRQILGMIMVGIILVATANLYAQTPPISSPSTPETAPVSSPDAAPAPDNLPMAPQMQVENDDKFHYTQSGRDPFVSLIEKGSEEGVNQGGLPSMLIAELALQGIQIGLGKVAMFKGPDNNVYGMRIGDACKDGKLIEIQNNRVMFEKIVFDEFGREKEKQQIEVYLHR